MTDKQIIETLRNLQNYCKQHIGCANCQFLDDNRLCQIRNLTLLLGFTPSVWNLEEIERIINEAD